MARFKPGQQVVCVRPNAPYRCHDKGLVTIWGPKFNEIVTIQSYYRHDRVVLLEYSGIDPYNGMESTFKEYYFEPLVSDAILREELESVPEPYTL